MSRLTGGLLGLGILYGTYCLGSQTPAQPGAEATRLIAEPGTFRSPDGSCSVRLAINPLGGSLMLTANTPSSINDVTGMAWLTDRLLVFTVSPIDGRPGVFTLACGSNQVTRIVAPKSITPDYPDGTDYFELLRVATSERPAVIYFYYAPDVNDVDFTTFPSSNDLFRVRLDGSGFQKAE